MLISLVTFALVILLTATTTAQTHGHQHPDMSTFKPRRVPPVQVRFRGELKPDSSLARGLMEIEFTNRSSDTLADIRMFTGIPIVDPRDSTTMVEPPFVHLDSMLYRGVPLSENELAIDGQTITVTLPQPLEPGERAFFIMTFESQMDSDNGRDGVAYAGWYPRVAAYHEGRWYTPTSGMTDRAVPSFADFTVSVGVDSAWHLVHPGELVNHKEHYGLLPPAHDDSIYVDIVHQHQQSYAGMKYTPVFEHGKKTYFIRSHNTIDFNVFAQKGLLRDRAYVDSLTIEVCYPPELADVWAGVVAKDAARMVRRLQTRLGMFPLKHLRIAPSRIYRVQVFSRNLLLTLYDPMEPSLYLATLAHNLTPCWFSPGLSDSADQLPYQRGLEYYTTLNLIYDISGREGFSMIEGHESMWKSFDRNERITKHVEPWLRTVPRMLCGVEAQVGDSVLWDAIGSWSQDHRFELRTNEDLRAWLDSLPQLETATDSCAVSPVLHTLWEER
ncbi:MAG: hypothetical protein OEV49_06885 [candidate division Zixibacteria bacterium]|nr:hypothetical protein [candidate division Zixibacteria bacterium]MDH3935726.1 hypothetical protein [candidate division Zixibacteria bacterium]MDH4033735.1 hypothetical protein [candidate division Zixibacteria bacterium]